MLRANRYALAAAQDVVALKARCARCTAVTTRCACGWASTGLLHVVGGSQRRDVH